ncbi:MAG: hypothetical protein GY792_26575 [Gammaproteobacteria bacterium]|nr:hypothetical protein [Gammaproteobacteria bacterium]
MDKLISNYRKKLQEITNQKQKASMVLAKLFNCEPEEIFYKFVSNELPESGKSDDGLRYFFHGYGCTVTNEIEGWKIDLEFGPNGETCAFDKFTICHLLQAKSANCQLLIDTLMENGAVKLVDESLFSIVKVGGNNQVWKSREQEIDACVADRYMFVKDLR